MYYHNNKSRNHAGNRGGASSSYVWQVSWYPLHGDKRYKSFTNKQAALMFMSQLKNGKNYFVSLEKWFG